MICCQNIEKIATKFLSGLANEYLSSPVYDFCHSWCWIWHSSVSSCLLYVLIVWLCKKTHLSKKLSYSNHSVHSLCVYWINTGCPANLFPLLFLNFSASYGSRNSIFDIFPQSFLCRFWKYPIVYFLIKSELRYW